jgi:hypothetical protein
MAERDADRARPELLRRQALKALMSDANREISKRFLQQLGKHDAAPDLFSSNELAHSAKNGLEAEIARHVGASRGFDALIAIQDALRLRGEGYVREQKCQLISDRHPRTTLASESAKRAFHEASLIAAALILDGQAAPRDRDRVELGDNLLSPQSSGANP